MRIEWEDTDDIEGAGQFVVYAETVTEIALVRRFAALNEKKDWRLQFYDYSNDYDTFTHERVIQFRFGLSRLK